MTTVTVETEGDAQLVVSVLDAQGRPKAARSVTMSTSWKTPIVQTDNNSGVASNPKKRPLPDGFEQFAPVLPEDTKKCNHSLTLRGSNAAQTRITCKECGLRLIAHADGTRVCEVQS